MLKAGPSPAGGQWCPAPHLKPVPPHFTFGPLVATYIQYCILKMCPPPSGFSSLLQNPCDGPGWRRKKITTKTPSCLSFTFSKTEIDQQQLIITKAKEMHCFVSFVNVYQAAHSSAPKKSSRVVWIERRVKKRTVKNLYFRPAFGWFRYNGSMHLSLVNVYLFFTQKSKLTFDRFSLKTHIPATWEQSVVITHHVTARVHTLRNKLKWKNRTALSEHTWASIIRRQGFFSELTWNQTTQQWSANFRYYVQNALSVVL